MFLLILKFNETDTAEPIMYLYKDFSYMKYVLGLDFIDGYRSFKIVQDRIFKQEENIIKDRLIHFYLHDVKNGYNKDFETYYKSKQKKQNNFNNLSKSEIIKTEERIISNVIKFDKSKFKERKLF